MLTKKIHNFALIAALAFVAVACGNKKETLFDLNEGEMANSLAPTEGELLGYYESNSSGRMQFRLKVEEEKLTIAMSCDSGSEKEYIQEEYEIVDTIGSTLLYFVTLDRPLDLEVDSGNIRCSLNSNDDDTLLVVMSGLQLDVGGMTNHDFIKFADLE